MPLLETFANASVRGWNPGVSTALPAFELISTTVLGSSAASVTFSGLGTSAAAYKHLQIRATARTNRATYKADIITLRMNSDSGSNYSTHRLAGNGSSVSSDFDNSGNISIAYSATTTGAANVYSGFIVDLLDHSSTNKYKTVRALGGMNDTGENWIQLASSSWRNTAAVTDLTFTALASFVSGSRFSLYGLRG